MWQARVRHQLSSVNDWRGEPLSQSLLNGQNHVERGALTDHGVELQLAAVLLDHHVVIDGQALAGALAHFLGGEEGLEHPLLDG